VSRLAELRNLGFDESEHVPFTKTYKVRCSQCQALAINNTPAHENGCPNRMSECDWCGQPCKGRFCDDECAQSYSR